MSKPVGPEQRATDVWVQVLATVAKRVSQQCFDTWFRPVVYAGCDETALHVTVPNESFRKWFLEHYAEVLREAGQEAAGASLQLDVSVETRGELPDGPAPFSVVRASALDTAGFRHCWLVEGLWTAQAVGIIGGAPKCGKTWMALEMAVSVASGSPCLGTFPIHGSGPVLLYAAEDSTAALRLRLQTLACHRSLNFDRLDVRVITAESLRLDRAPDQERLHATVTLHQPALLVLDPLVRLHSIDENLAGEVAALLGYLRALQRKTGVAIALVHHARKNISPGGGAGHSLRGSSDLYAWVDSFLYLQHRRDQLTLSAEHRSAPGLGPLPLKLVESSLPGTGPHLKLISPPETDPSPSEDPLLSQILDLLSKTGPLTAEHLRSALQVRNQRVIEALRKLSTQGKVMPSAQGYRLKINPSPLQ